MFVFLMLVLAMLAAYWVVRVTDPYPTIPSIPKIPSSDRLSSQHKVRERIKKSLEGEAASYSVYGPNAVLCRAPEPDRFTPMRQQQSTRYITPVYRPSVVVETPVILGPVCVEDTYTPYCPSDTWGFGSSDSPSSCSSYDSSSDFSTGGSFGSDSSSSYSSDSSSSFSTGGDF